MRSKPGSTRGATRPTRWCPLLVLVSAMLMSACSIAQQPESEDEVQAVVEEFFYNLEKGFTEYLPPLLSETSALRSTTDDIFNSTMYVQSVAWVADSTVHEPRATSEGKYEVDVDYTLAPDGDDRSMTVLVEEFEDEPLITGWENEILDIEYDTGEAVFTVNGIISTRPLYQMKQFVALPGIYSFSYRDLSSTTVLSEDDPYERMAIEFPVDPSQLAGSAPAGIRAEGSTILVEPKLAERTIWYLQDWFEDSTDRCLEDGLTGEHCPLVIPDLENFTSAELAGADAEWQLGNLTLLPGPTWRVEFDVEADLVIGDTDVHAEDTVTGSIVPQSKESTIPILELDD